MDEEIMTAPQPEETVEVVDIQFRPGQKVYFFDPAGEKYREGDVVVMDTARGPEAGICAGGNHHISTKNVVAPLRQVLRHATAEDQRIIARNRAEEKRAFDVCLQKIADHKLDMQLVSAEVVFDGSKILFFFTADERVDFRDLVKNLASVFHTRIELRQIGVRDKAKMVGGLGICGRPFCCTSFLDDFQPVSIKMAKTQNLSLNPTKISGTCGRLMCCLKYEQDAYEDLLRTSPKSDSFVDTPDGRGTVIEVDVLRQRVKVRMENAPETVNVYPNTDIAVLRSGKAKRTDPPIPADLAPISGGGKRAERAKKEEETMTLEPIRFRYSTEKIVEEPEQKAEPVQAPAEEKEQRPSRNRRRRGGDGPRQERPAGEEKTRQEKSQAPKQEKAPRPERGPKPNKQENPQLAKAEGEKPQTAEKPEGEQAKRPNRRRNNFRRRKPKAKPEGQQ